MNPVLATRPRIPLWVDEDDAIVSQHLLREGDWDAPLADFLEEFLRPDDVFLDLGAHVGYFSLIAAKKCKRVIAVEPQQDLCHLMRKSRHLHGLHKEFWVWPMAVGVEQGYHDLFVPVNRGSASFHHRDGEPERVWVTGLKDIGRDATVAKVDIEGDDYALLAANPKFLAGLRIVICEYRTGDEALFGLLKDAGFDLWKVNDGERLKEPPELPEGFYVNLVGVRG